ncbi:proline--tRNA ligase [Paenibacillus lemnae]|uniref:Proline--tRNA ligase n=1 Tax=Paenibacillus lemnae TaxID=1330551 RepID=A0A848M623_PAELE|nr:proline--tRNA ligase [Paenibacillus lemnae]NMO95263.1 proline--tRNA ligase [Paenibacillus lemnae]
MRQSRLFMPTLREVPAEAEALSHQWMLRGGYIRQTASGMYTYLPLGWKVLQKIEHIIREEMDASGAQELHMPAIQPAELWKESGRYNVYGPELMRLQDRHDREFVLGPTHEEVITALVRSDISSYRSLPLNLYQIQTKFRDERRPRFGLLRGREFLMKDAYSFDRDWEGLDVTYRSMYETYERIFHRCGLTFRAVAADSGAIGGQGETHEFMALADIGEDTIVSCSGCRYAANLETAEFRVPNLDSGLDLDPAGSYAKQAAAPPEVVHTPDVRTITELTEYLQVTAHEIIKTLLYVADGRLAAVLVRGDRDVNEIKVKNKLQADTLELASAEDVMKATGAGIGFAGPVGLTFNILVDNEVAGMTEGVTGANQDDTHLRHVVPGVHFSLEYAGDYRNAEEGDQCQHCGSALEFHRGIELGHVFKLGTKYSETLGASFLDHDGREKPFVMGCYGIGVSRIMSAAAEQSITGERLLWPKAIAPFDVHIIAVSVKDETQMNAAEQMYRELSSAGLDVLLDDRNERAGVKFKDADLAGVPMRIVAGRGAASGEVEWMGSDGEKVVVTVKEAVERAINGAQKTEQTGGERRP